MNPTALALEEHGLVYMAQMVSEPRFIALWLATENGHEHPAVKEDARLAHLLPQRAHGQNT